MLGNPTFIRCTINGFRLYCTCRRILLPLEEGKQPVVEDLVGDHGSYGDYMELPCMNPAFKKDGSYQFAYAGTIVRPSPLINQVIAW
jgi:hypothetical protein